jgi:hypothetical protein
MGRARFRPSAGGVSDKTTIAIAKLQAAIRAALEPCAPALISEPAVGMLSDLQSKQVAITSRQLLQALRCSGTDLANCLFDELPFPRTAPYLRAATHKRSDTTWSSFALI